MNDQSTETTQRYIITGGPGSGKTTLLRALESAGYPCFDEVSREVIREQQQSDNSDITPWGDLLSFADVVFERMRYQLDESGRFRICFFDRAMPDIVAYLQEAGLPVADRYLRYATPEFYHPTVLVTPPWEEIFVNDNERPESYEKSVALYEALVETYTGLGFSLVTLPKTTVAERRKWVLNYYTPARSEDLAGT